MATFGVATYLRYAKADASKAEEPRHDLSLPLAEADRHTALLSESAEGAISSVVASLSIGDRVELEWLQMRLPGAPFDSEPVRVCPKLARVTEAEEKRLGLNSLEGIFLMIIGGNAWLLVISLRVIWV